MRISYPVTSDNRRVAGFTMMEIAICLAIIGFALVAIIGVLPIGMNTQRDNRQETIINQDASVLLNDIRSGARGADELTNYVYAISNAITFFPQSGAPSFVGHFGYTYTSGYNGYALTNGFRIIGLLSTPEFTDSSGRPISDLTGVDYYSNHVVAYVRSISGVAAEKPPQDNQIMREDTFTYHLYCVNASIPVDTNSPFKGFTRELAANQRELRLTFLWPQYPNGKVGNGRHTFRATIAGQLHPEYYSGQTFYFYQPQFFTNSL